MGQDVNTEHAANFERRESYKLNDNSCTIALDEFTKPFGNF